MLHLTKSFLGNSSNEGPVASAGKLAHGIFSLVVAT
jgi:hypothetical protein